MSDFTDFLGSVSKHDFDLYTGGQFSEGADLPESDAVLADESKKAYFKFVETVLHAQPGRIGFEWTAKDKDAMGVEILKELDAIGHSDHDEHEKGIMKQALFDNIVMAEMALNGYDDKDRFASAIGKECLVDPGTYLILGANGHTVYDASINGGLEDRYKDMYNLDYADLPGYDDVSLVGLVVQGEKDGLTNDSWQTDTHGAFEAGNMVRRMINMHMDVVDDAVKAQVVYNELIGDKNTLMFGEAVNDYLVYEEPFEEKMYGNELTASQIVDEYAGKTAGAEVEAAKTAWKAYDPNLRVIDNQPDFIKADEKESGVEFD